MAHRSNKVVLYTLGLAWKHTKKPSDVLNMNDAFIVKCLGTDPKTHKMKVSRKQLLTLAST